MFPLSHLQPSHNPLCVYREPALTLWPPTRPIFEQLENDRLGMRNEMERRMQSVNQAYQQLALDMDMDMGRRTGHIRQPVAQEISHQRGREGNKNFDLTLDVSLFSPDELTVKIEGRRLIVMGKHDKKSDARDGNYFHEYREWKREAEIPEDVNPAEVLCSRSSDGRLHVQAPRLALPAVTERPIPISITSAPEDGQKNNN
ncbi:heat shock protein 30C-like [Ascaphus truei]|uniref:heat shock protein 30C-like n=1 Tax=Ascaphus truei TaxID=8439 RepID=UPI003F5A3348